MADTQQKLSEKQSLLSLKELIDERFGKGNWKDLEPETILIEFHTDFSVLLFDKLMLLKLLEEDPNRFMDSPVFFLAGVEVANNTVADFEYTPHPTSLEIAWALDQFLSILKDDDVPFVPGDGLIKTVGYLLRDDGFSEPVHPFEFIPKSELSTGVPANDMKLKAQAVIEYLKYMRGVK